MSSYLVGVLVKQVKRVAGELGATAGVAVDQERVLVACSVEIRNELEFGFPNEAKVPKRENWRGRTYG